MSAARRIFALLFAVAQTSLGAGFAVVDGRLEAQAVAEAAAPHAEGERSPTCPRQHLADCAVCRALGLQSAPSRAPVLAASSTTTAKAVAEPERDPRHYATTRLPDSRAPPSAPAGASRLSPS